MAKPQGYCVFCGGPGLTKQHIWPEWLKKYNLPEDTHHFQLTAEGSRESRTLIPTKSERRQGHSGSRKLYKVCRTCNGGWIRRLEESVMRIVLQLMDGTPITLEQNHQRALSAWLALLTIMSEFTHPPTQAVPAADRRYLMEKIEAPPGWRVFIAQYTGTNWRQFICRHYGMQLTEPLDKDVHPHKCDTQTSTFVIGQLCAHTFSSTVLADDFQGYQGRAIIQSWPVETERLTWGTAPGMGDVGVNSLSTALIRSIPPAEVG